MNFPFYDQTQIETVQKLYETSKLLLRSDVGQRLLACKILFPQIQYLKV